jgi:hypothetical protein
LRVFALLDKTKRIEKEMLKQLLIVLCLSNLVACAASEERPETESAGASSAGSDCISQGSIRDYRVLDAANLIVTEGVSRKYHVVLSRPAHGLSSTWRIAFSAPSGRVCSKFSDLVVDDSIVPQKIRIASVNRLTPEDEEELLIRFGKKEPETVQPRQPEDIEGAEVEGLD